MNHDTKEKIIKYIDELKYFYEERKFDREMHEYSESAIDTCERIKEFIEEIYK